MTNILFTTILIVILFVLCIAVAAYSTWAERKVAAIMQDRIGPNRAGPFGLYNHWQMEVSFSSRKSLCRKMPRNFIHPCTRYSDVYFLAYGSCYPMGKTLNIGGESLPVQVANIDVGVLFLIGMASTSVYAIMIGGWASNNKFSLISAVRASSQMISYELAMGLSLLSIVLMNGSLDLRVITENQAGWGGMKWNIVLQPVAFIIFLFARWRNVTVHLLT